MTKKKFFMVFSIIVLIVLIVLIFFPKTFHGGSYAAARNVRCKCFGFETIREAMGPYRYTCYGIPYSCSFEFIK